MFREITLTKADGESEAFPFMATATTAIRFRSLFQKELLASITSIVTAAGTDQLAKLMATVNQAAEEGQTELNPENLDPELLQVLIKIVGSGDMDTISKMAYIMNQQAVKADMSRLDLDGYVNWLDQFDTMEFLTHSMDFITLYMSNRASTSTQKKDTAQLIEK